MSMVIHTLVSHYREIFAMDMSVDHVCRGMDNLDGYCTQ